MAKRSTPTTVADDPWLFGWDPTPGIVSVWATPRGQALVWRRTTKPPHFEEEVICESAHFRPWLYATHLQDIDHLGLQLAKDDDTAAFSYRELSGPAGALRYLISAQDGRALEQLLLEKARRRLGRDIGSLNDTGDYYQVGPVEQYLMQTGRSYFRDLPFSYLHRLQVDPRPLWFDPPA
jgi:DNA polymerase, archaea type